MADVPFKFVPQSQQPIDSAQMDANFDSVDGRLDALEAGAQTGGNQTITAKYTFNQRPEFAGVIAPTPNGLVDRKWVEASRGCSIGDGFWTFNPNPNVTSAAYGIEWARPQGQQYSRTAYPDLFALCQNIGSSSAGRYNPLAGQPADKFVIWNMNGRPLVARQGSNGALNNKVPGFSVANFLANNIGETTHKQATNEVANHPHSLAMIEQAIYGAGSRRAISVDTSNSLATLENQSAANVQPMNIVNSSITADFWVRVK